MNFSPFGVGVPLSAAMPVTTQFTTGKLAQNVTAANGQVVGVLQGGENGVHYIRPLETSAFAQAASPTPNQGQTQTLITLPITMPGAKPGDPQQTVQIQVVNSAPITTMTPTTSANSPKYQISQIPIQTFGQGATVLTVAYNPSQEGIQIVDGQNGIPEGMTVVAALQPQDIQMLQQQQHQQQQPQLEAAPTNNAAGDKDPKDITISPVSIIKTENPGDKSDYIQTSTVQEYLQRIQTHTLPLSLQQFLKFNTDVKRENIISEDGVMEGVVETQEGVEQDHEQHLIMNEYAEPGMETEEVVDDPEKTKKKKKYKKKTPKPKTPKPGQVHIATALDGTMLFCCPECHMAYPEKELLEQHLVGHKIERRFICGICGAGLKRKEHLERHKLGHNPERPFVCSVCSKGFKRKEHLNLHFVIHSGEKTEICGECGKGFYRKDHLRKHTRSHMTRRVKEQAQGSVIGKDGTAQVTIQVPTSQTPIQIPVQIQVPQHHIQVTTNTDEDGQVSTVVLPTASEGITIIPN